jgi:3-oxoacyl-[acyl-carrier protein] reductase
VRCDVTVKHDVQACFRLAVERFGAVDVVVHNASRRSPVPGVTLEDVDRQLWDEYVAVSLRGAFYFAKSAFPLLRGRDGRFIVIGSVAGIEGSSSRPAYSAVKGALRGFVKSLAQEWGPYGITVNCLVPAALTRGMREAFEDEPALREWLLQVTLMRRIGHPIEDIGPPCVFLASSSSGFITGQTLLVQGGRYLGL